MAKTTKGGRVMNPTDAARKQARKKEIARNKLERDMQRATPKDVPEINKRLAELLEEEEAEKARGRPISKQLHIKRKVLQDAMKLAVAKERETGMKEKFGSEGVQTTPHGHGVPQRRPEDSVYFHPVHNPTGAPPPGRPQRYKDDVSLMDPSKADDFEAMHKARLHATLATDTSGLVQAEVLPPPDEPPPNMLPPPDGPPPGVLPPPPGPPPGYGPVHPQLPPPNWVPPPPAGPPPGFPPGALLPHRATEAIVEGAATATRTVPAPQDTRLTAMVPATVRAKRQKPRPAAARLPVIPNVDNNAGFGLAPQTGPGASAGIADASVASFLDEINNL